MRDIVVFTSLVVSAAWLFTTHLAVAWGLLRRPPRRDALFAFVLAPAAPWFAWRHGMKVRSVMWIVAAVTYVVTRVIASR